MNPGEGWIGIDLDGTLAKWEGWSEKPGPPIEIMVDRVKRLVESGYNVRIFTARVAASNRVTEFGIDDANWAEVQRKNIEEWCLEHIGYKLPVTAIKDFDMIEFWDDRAINVSHNQGFLNGVSVVSEVLRRR